MTVPLAKARDRAKKPTWLGLRWRRQREEAGPLMSSAVSHAPPPHWGRGFEVGRWGAAVDKALSSLGLRVLVSCPGF